MTETDFIIWKREIITFTNNAKIPILAMFGKTVDQDGYIVEMANSAQRVLTPDGEDITIHEFAGIRMQDGKEVFIKNDLKSMLKLVDEIRLENLQYGKNPECETRSPEKFVYVNAGKER